MRKSNWIRALILLVCLLALFGSQPSAANRRQANPSPEVPPERWSRMQRGTNLSHWLTHKPYLNPDTMRGFISDEEIRSIKAMGFDHVRIPFAVDAVATSYDPVRLDGTRVSILRQRLAAFRKAGLFVILDFHPDEDFKARLRNSPPEVMRLRRFWQALAGQLRDLDPQWIALEVMNEPNYGDAREWWSIQQVLMRDLRGLVPQHTLVVQADRWSSVDELLAMRPYDDRNVVYAFHYYEPFIFTHQQAKWVDDHLGGWRDVAYPTTDSNLRDLRRQANSELRRSMLERFEKERWGPSQIGRRLQLVADWAKRYNVKVMCNEFGTQRAQIKAPSRIAWHRDVARALEARGIGWTHWEFRGGMGLFYADSTTAKGQEGADWDLIDALGLNRPALAR